MANDEPGADQIDMSQELERVLPVIEALAGGGVPLSIDTRKGLVMEQAAHAGVRLINDISALTFDADSLAMAKKLSLPVVLMQTAHFARAPRRWLELVSKHRGTITYAPNFAYQLVTKRVRDKDLEALDLSSLRHMANGAEPVSASTIRRFTERFSNYGFRPDAMRPVYGMAENTLGLGKER